MSREKLTEQGKQIKKALIDLDMSYMELAKSCGIGVYYVREIIAGTRKAVDMRKKIAACLREGYRKNGWQVPRAFAADKKKEAA
jgi:predicted transcriptional regulator